LLSVLEIKLCHRSRCSYYSFGSIGL